MAAHFSSKETHLDCQNEYEEVVTANYQLVSISMRLSIDMTSIGKWLTLCSDFSGFQAPSEGVLTTLDCLSSSCEMANHWSIMSGGEVYCIEMSFDKPQPHVKIWYRGLYLLANIDYQGSWHKHNYIRSSSCLDYSTLTVGARYSS